MKPFRTAWITEPGYDFSAIEKYCKEVKFLTKGYEKDTMKMADSVSSSLEEFDVATDVIVPVGKVLSVWLVALSVCARNITSPCSLTYAVYQGGEYTFRKWDLTEGVHMEMDVRVEEGG